MKKLAGMLALITMGPISYADNLMTKPMLDKVLFQMAEKQWVTTQTALLSVSINVTLDSPDLVKARSAIMDSLNQVAKGDWHLVEFDRSQDSSGLEKLFVQAQARVDQSVLTNIYQNAKSVSAPGAKYEVSGVEFKPSLEEVQTIRAKVREQLYQKVNDEMARINKVYPGQHYSVSRLVFIEGEGVPQPQTTAYRAKEMNVMAMAAASAPLTVSNEIVLTAMVEAASNRQQGN